MIDSGASHHLTGQLDCLTETRECAPLVVRVADGRTVVAKQKGTLKINTLVDSGDGGCAVREFELKNVYYVPNFAKTLLSVSSLIHAGHEIAFAETGCSGCITRNGAIEWFAWRATRTECTRS
jgi:hypothetical protein